VAVAAQVLHQIGLRQTTMDDIARALKTSKIAIYRYFPTKDELLAAVLKEVAEALIADEHRPWPGLKRAMRRGLQLARTRPEAFLLLTRSAAHDAELWRHFDQVRTISVEATKRRLTLLEHPICHDPLLLDVTAQGLTDYIYGTLATWVESGDPARDEEWLKHVANAAIRLVGWPAEVRVGTLPPVFDAQPPD